MLMSLSGPKTLLMRINMADTPPDPFLPEGISDAMKGMYEMYAGAVQSGFSPEQAMQLVVAMFTTMMKAPPSK